MGSIFLKFALKAAASGAIGVGVGIGGGILALGALYYIVRNKS